MKAGAKLFKMMAAKAPRMRGFSNRLYFGHPFLDAWFGWFPLNQIQYDGSAIGEIYNVASRIDERSLTSWISEWTGEGHRVREAAERIEAQGHGYSASRAYLRAYTYYRTAHLATDPVLFDAEMRSSYESLTTCFDRFRSLSGKAIERVEVPLRGTEQTMRGYFFDCGTPGAPTLMWINGAESLVEDVYWWCAAEGVDRGFHVFAVDGPGDTATRIERPEPTIQGAGDRMLLSQVDYILARPEVDPKKFFVYGISMGGFKAGRLAQIDHRATGIVANAPMLDASKVLAAVRDMHKAPKQTHGWAHRMFWQYGVETTGNLKVDLEQLVDGVWGKFIADPTEATVPFLVMAGENELGSEGIRQAHEFYDRLGSTVKGKRIITAAEGGAAHCQLDNFPLARQIVFDWIEDIATGKEGRTGRVA